MKPAFYFEVDVAANLVRITMSGFFDPADIEAFATARNDAHRLLRCGPNQHLTLVDIREMQIQSQESVVRFQDLLSNPATASRKIAFVVTRSLARMQIERAAANRSAAYFDNDLRAAERWLLQTGS